MRRDASWSPTISPRSSRGSRSGATRLASPVAGRPHAVRDPRRRVPVHAPATGRPRPAIANLDYPLCYPGAGYPDETRQNRLIEITKVDPRNLPDDLRDPDGIRCGYVPSDRPTRVPGLGSPNAPESSSVYVLDVTNPANPRRQIVKTGRGRRREDARRMARTRAAGNRRQAMAGRHRRCVYSGSHPNAVVVGPRADLRGERQQRQYLNPRPGDLPGAGADRAVAASRPRPAC